MTIYVNLWKNRLSKEVRAYTVVTTVNIICMYKTYNNLCGFMRILENFTFVSLTRKEQQNCEVCQFQSKCSLTLKKTVLI